MVTLHALLTSGGKFDAGFSSHSDETVKQMTLAVERAIKHKINQPNKIHVLDDN